MAYIFHESELPSLISKVPGRERIFFVNQELARTDDMLAGVMHYRKAAASPYHLHKNCEHFYFIIDGKAQVETEQGVRPVGLATWFLFQPKRSIGCARSNRSFISNGRRQIASRQQF